MSPSHKEQRAWRRSKDLVRVDVADADSPNEPCTGWIVDHSRGGICVTFDPQPLELDLSETLTVRPSRTDNQVEVRVKNFRKVSGQVQLGCEFVQQGDDTVFARATGNWL